jgi:hypothetical protein
METESNPKEILYQAVVLRELQSTALIRTYRKAQYCCRSVLATNPNPELQQRELLQEQMGWFWKNSIVSWIISCYCSYYTQVICLEN